MCLIDYADPYGCLAVTRPKARKAHQCDECLRTIAPGEKYKRAVFKNEGELLTFCMCTHCEAAASWLVKHCGGYVHGGVLDDLTEHGGEDYKADADFLKLATAGIKARWHQGALMPLTPLGPSEAV